MNITPNRSDRRLKPRLKRGSICALLPLLGFTVIAAGQPVTSDEAIEELRKRSPSGANDQKNVDDFLAAQITTLAGANNAAQASNAFRDTLRRLRSAPDSTTGFKDFLADQFSLLATAELNKKQETPPAVAEALVRSAVEMNDKRTAAALFAGLTYPSAPIRYLAARGLTDIRDAFVANQQAAAIAQLRQAGIAETSGVVVERIYRAMAFSTTPVPAAISAIIDVMKSRVEAYRQGGSLPDEAESKALTYLSGIQIPAQLRADLVQQLAPLLRLDVERFARGGMSLEDEGSLARRLDYCETLLESVTGGSPANIRAKMQDGGIGAATEMKLELLKWIGANPGEDGALTRNPWNVPRGAP